MVIIELRMNLPLWINILMYFHNCYRVFNANSFHCWLFYLFIWPCHGACRILPWSGIKPVTPAMKAEPQPLDHPGSLQITFERKKTLQILLKPHPTSLSPLSLLNGCHHPEQSIYYFNECFYTFISYARKLTAALCVIAKRWIQLNWING